MTSQHLKEAVKRNFLFFGLSLQSHFLPPSPLPSPAFVSFEECEKQTLSGPGDWVNSNSFSTFIKSPSKIATPIWLTEKKVKFTICGLGKKKVKLTKGSLSRRSGELWTQKFVYKVTFGWSVEILHRYVCGGHLPPSPGSPLQNHNSAITRDCVDLTSKMESTPKTGSYRHFFGNFSVRYEEIRVCITICIYTSPQGGEGGSRRRGGCIYTWEKFMKILLYDVIFDVESIFDVKSSVSRRNRELSPKNAFRRGEPLEGGRGRPHTWWCSGSCSYTKVNMYTNFQGHITSHGWNLENLTFFFRIASGEFDFFSR